MKLYLCAIILTSGSWAQVPDYNTDQQIKLYQDWVAKNPSSVSNRTLLAGAYVQKTRETTDFSYLDRASKVLASVLSETPGHEALRLRNIVELTLHHFANAAAYAREMVQRWPGDVQSWGTLGDALLEMGQYDAARDAFAKMVELKPGLMSYNRLGFYRFVTGDPDAGIALMKKAVDAAAKYPENKAWCLVELGNIYFKTGHWAEARSAYQSAIATFPGSHAAYAALGGVQAAQGKLRDAIGSYQRAQSITPMIQYAGALFDLYSAIGKPEEAKNQLELIDVVARLEAASGFQANRTLALMYANEDRNLDTALTLAQTDLELRHDVYTYDALAWVLYMNGRYQDARRASEKALSIGAPEALFYFHAGMIAAALKDNAGARANLERALALNPGFDFRLSKIARQALAGISGDSE